MTEAGELETLLNRLTESHQALVEALKSLDPKDFEAEQSDGSSIKRSLERTVDDVNFYYGSLVARCLNLPQPPCLSTADFSSLREATMAVQVAHRRFGGLLHDVLPDDLEKSAADDKHTTYTLRQILEMATAHYNLRTRQMRATAEGASTPG
jgi:hypothetical protein